MNTSSASSINQFNNNNSSHKYASGNNFNYSSNMQVNNDNNSYDLNAHSVSRNYITINDENSENNKRHSDGKGSGSQFHIQMDNYKKTSEFSVDNMSSNGFPLTNP